MNKGVMNGGEPEDRVIMSLTPGPDFVEEIFAAFQRNYPGIETSYIPEEGGVGFLDLLSALEKGAVSSDIILLNEQQKEVLKLRGLLESYTSPESAGFPEWARDPDGYGVQVFLKPFSIAYNTEKVAETDAPRRYADLLDPKWKGKLIYPDPHFGGSGFGWFAAMKDYLGGDFFQQLAKQDPQCQTAPESGLLTGDRPVLVAGMVDRIEKMKDEGKPVDWVPLQVMWFAGPFACLFREAKHPNIGRRLIDFLLSREGQQILSCYNIPNRPDISLEGRFARIRERLKATRPVPFDPFLGRDYHKNHEEAFRLLVTTASP